MESIKYWQKQLKMMNESSDFEDDLDTRIDSDRNEWDSRNKEFIEIFNNDLNIDEKMIFMNLIARVIDEVKLKNKMKDIKYK